MKWFKLSLILITLLMYPFLSITSISASPTDQKKQSYTIFHRTTRTTMDSMNDNKPKNSFSTQQQSNNYTALFINETGIIGWPYFQTFFPENGNFTINYNLEANKTYTAFLYGDYLKKQVDLDIWITWYNTTSNTTEMVTFTRNHDLGQQDILQFSVTTTGKYSIVIYNHVSLEEFSLIGLILLETMTIDDSKKESFHVQEPTVRPLSVTPQYHTYQGLFIPWQDTYQDVNFTITFFPSENHPITLNASIYPAFTPRDLLLYDPYHPESLQQALSVTTISTKSARNSISTVLGPREKGWMSIPGLIIFIETIEGNGDLQISVNTIEQYDIKYTTPLGVPQYFMLNQTSTYTLISYYLDANTKHDGFLWVIDGLPPTSPDNRQDILESIKLQVWKGSPLEAEKNFLDPTKVPLMLKESRNTIKHLKAFQPTTSGRYTFIAYLDNTKNINMSKPLTLAFNIFERWDLSQSRNQEFIVTARSTINPSEYTLQSFKTFFIPIKQWKGKNITFQVTIPNSLEIETQLHPFTSMTDQLKFTPFTHSSSITWKKGLNQQITIAAEVGRRNKDKVNDTYWILSIIGISGSGTIRISWAAANVPINWIDLTITGTILMACLVILIIFSWKGEKYLYSF